MHEVKNRVLYRNFIDDVNDQLSKMGIVTWNDDIDIILRALEISNDQFSKEFYIYYFELIILSKAKSKKRYFNEKTFYLVDDNIDFNKVKTNAKKVSIFLNKSIQPVLEESNFLNQLSINYSTYSQNEMNLLQRLVEDLSQYLYHPLGRYEKKRKGVTTYAFQILKSNRAPMHYSKIAERVKKQSKHEYSNQAVANAMLASPLFHSIGNGNYALSSWGMEKYNRTRHDNKLSVKSLVREYIKKNGSSKYEDISNFVKAKRKASDHTVHQALSDLGCRQDPHKNYHWNNKKRISLEQRIYRCLLEIGPSTIDEIIQFTQKYRKYPKSSYYLRLHLMGCVRDEVGKYHLNSYKPKARNGSKTIKKELESYLRQNGAVSLNQIYRDLSIQRKVSKNTIKSYLGNMGLKQDDQGKYFLHSFK